jgi:hypothetical protein
MTTTPQEVRLIGLDGIHEVMSGADLVKMAADLVMDLARDLFR